MEGIGRDFGRLIAGGVLLAAVLLVLLVVAIGIIAVISTRTADAHSNSIDDFETAPFAYVCSGERCAPLATVGVSPAWRCIAFSPDHSLCLVVDELAPGPMCIASDRGEGL